MVEVSETAQALPFRFVGTLYISGDIWGNGDVNRCHGEGFVRVLGDPIGTEERTFATKAERAAVPWIVAVALTVLGGIGLLVATPYTVHWEIDPTSGERLHTGPIST